MGPTRTTGEGPHVPYGQPHWPRHLVTQGNEEIEPLRLILVGGRMSLELRQRDTLVGRHSDADVRLPLPDVSRRHCRFVHDQGRWEVVDLNSLNGVFVNDEAVQDRRELHHRDRVRIGGFTFEVDMHPGEQTVGLAAGEVGDSGEVLRSIAEALPSPQTLPEVPQRRAS